MPTTPENRPRHIPVAKTEEFLFAVQRVRTSGRWPVCNVVYACTKTQQATLDPELKTAMSGSGIMKAIAPIQRPLRGKAEDSLPVVFDIPAPSVCMEHQVQKAKPHRQLHWEDECPSPVPVESSNAMPPLTARVANRSAPEQGDPPRTANTLNTLRHASS